MKVLFLLPVALQALSLVQGAQFSFSNTESHKENNGPLSNLHEVLEEARVKSGIYGMSVAILHKGKLIFAEGFGKRNDHDKFTAETVAPIASLSKAFTAAAVGELVAEGKIDWDKTPVSQYLPEFQLKDPVLTSQLNLQDLLSHRTPVPSVDLGWFWSTVPPRELIKRLRYVDMDPKLKPFLNYNNVMYTVAGEAAANAVNISYEELVETKIFKPLGLSHTGVSQKTMRKKERNYALGYEATSFEDAQKGRFRSLPVDSMAGVSAPAGDLYSNVLDLVRWGNVIMRRGKSQEGQQVLSKDSAKELLRAHSIVASEDQVTEFGPALVYGLGWLIDSYKGNPIYYHSGHVAGFFSNLFFMPGQELVIAHLTNTDLAELPSLLPYYIADELFNLPRTQDWLNDKVINSTKLTFERRGKMAQGDLPKRVRNKLPTRPFDDFVGVYTNPVFGDIVIESKTNSNSSSNSNNNESKDLFFKFQVYSGKLEHYHYDSFFAGLQHSSFRIGELLTFITANDGNVKSIEVELDGLSEVFLKKE